MYWVYTSRCRSAPYGFAQRSIFTRITLRCATGRFYKFAPYSSWTTFGATGLDGTSRNKMQRSRILVINDYRELGGAEIIYQLSVDVLKATPGVDVECFDMQKASLRGSVLTKTWNFPAAVALAKTIEAFRPDRVLVHNYHNALSSSVLWVLRRYKRKYGFLAYMTCHDFYLVYYNAALMHYVDGKSKPLDLNILRTRRALLARSSASGPVYDTFKKMHWHVARMLGNPTRLFDMFLCPSPFMQEALHKAGIPNTASLFNPSVMTEPLSQPKVCSRDKIVLAFVGRVAPEKGLSQLIGLARATSFAYIDHIAVYGDGPGLPSIRESHTDLIESGQLVMRGALPRDKLFAELRRSADALILPSVGAENAPLVVVEAAQMGLPMLVHDIGSLSTFGEEIGNKIKYSFHPTSFVKALGEVVAHLSDKNRKYDVSAYSLPAYAVRLASLMDVGE
ncbi:glycosyltransferase [Paraburkholderia youngii]|uniref:glycosyltransferase n=1 Tax=Paraburkholderia youngii TaxID=2782701 RepID=UPI003D2259C5